MGTEIVVQEVDERTRRQVLALLGRKSLREIAESIGVTPDVVIRIKQDIVDSIDALTVEEHLAQSLSLLRDVAENAREEFERTDDARSKAPLLGAAVSATKLFMSELNKWNDKNSGAANTLNMARQRELITLMQETINGGVKDIEDQFGVDAQEMYEIFNKRLIEAAMGMESRNE